MQIQIRNRWSDFNSYRAARVKSLFNAESGCNFDLDAELDLSGEWSIGVVVGPSGSGKTSIGRQIFGEPAPFWTPEWPSDAPIIDAIAPEGDFNVVTAALGSVGLGSVPTWLRPYPVLSNGEKFRADLARLVCEAPETAVVDEFTSVVDRQIAKFGALTFAKAWRRLKGKQVVLLTPHYDVVEWLEPDWVFDTAKRSFARRLLRRPQFDLEIWKTDGSLWPLFEPHHYAGARRRERPAAWPQGDAIFHTSHPQLCQALRRDKRWRQISAAMVGQNKKRGAASIAKSHTKNGKPGGAAAGYGGHFRAVQGFRYYGQKGLA
jgi:energy-coupling factor transporter ATP-binding protein EcfA2